jgi:hypothetical protein
VIVGSFVLWKPRGNVMSKPCSINPSSGGKGKPPATPAPTPDCIDLSERFGRRYRVEYEESYWAQYGPRARVNDPWLKIIPCPAGHICPWGGPTLAAVTDKAGPIAGKLAALPEADLCQDGSDGATVLFDVSDFEAVAQIIHPRRCRQLSPERRKKLGEAGAKHRFAHGAQKRREPRPCVREGLLNMEAVPTRSSVSGAGGDAGTSQTVR